MLRLVIAAVVAATIQAEILDGTVNIEDVFEPQVAFLCGRPSRYLTSQGWQLDRTQACLSKADDIMAYCALKYPQLTITNVIPASSEKDLADWGSFNSPNDVQTFTVRPYRCIAGDFESDALLVPDTCVFGHYDSNSEATRCSTYDEWNTTAAQRCVANNLTLYSFSVIIPCSPGLFGSAEYVCCPPGSQSQPQIADVDSVFDELPKPLVESVPVSPAGGLSSVGPQSQFSTTEYAVDDVDIDAEDDDERNDDEDDAMDFMDDTITPDEFAEFDSSKNYYTMYMETPELLGANEHEAYTKALRFVRHYYEIQKDQLLTQFDEVEDRAAVLSAKNITAAQGLREQGLKTLEQLYDATDATWKKVKQAMEDEHYRRVELRLEDKRLDRVENLMNTLDEAAEYDDLQAVQPLMKALKQYIRAEEKERIQWINRYEHLLDTNPSEAERIRLTVQEMLIQIQQRFAAVVDSLKRVPRIESTVRSLLREVLDSYADVDQEVRLLFPDLDITGELEQMLPSLDDADRSIVVPGPEIMEPANDDELNSDSAAADMTYQPRKRHNTIILVSVGATVLASVFVVIMALLCTRYCRRSQTRRQRVPTAKPTSIFLVQTAEDGKSDPMDVSFAVPSARSIVRSPGPASIVDSLRRMQMRGYENPISRNAQLAFDEDENASLVDRDVLQLQA